MLTDGLAALGDGDDSGFRCLYLAAPEVLDLEVVEGFVFSSERGSDNTVYPELKLIDYVETRVGRGPGLSTEHAKGDRIMVRLEGEVDRRLASVYRCLIAEVTLGAETYQLVDGHWYRVEPSFAARIREQVAKVPEAQIVFPLHHEGRTRTSTTSALPRRWETLLLDGQNIPIGGGANRIEFCDIAFHDRTLVHAKKRSSSSTLSHLWSQATVAFDALLGDPEFRGRLRERIRDLDDTYEGIADDGLTGSDYQVIYLVLGVEEGIAAWEALPFFSQVALAQAVRTSRQHGSLSRARWRIGLAQSPSVHGPPSDCPGNADLRRLAGRSRISWYVLHLPGLLFDRYPFPGTSNTRAVLHDVAVHVVLPPIPGVLIPPVLTFISV